MELTVACKRLARCFLPKPRYISGTVATEWGEISDARLDTKTGRVQFILWRAGEQGHKKDVWHDMGEGWENHFSPNEEV